MFSASCSGGSDATTASPTATAAPATPTALAASTGLTPTPGPFLYVVKDGDVLGTIADSFGISGTSLAEANQITDQTSISVGQFLVIPGLTATPPPTPAPTSASTDNALRIHMSMPIAGACLTPDDDQIPNAPREYRAGVHEGVDFFTSYACVDVPKGASVLATANGKIIRADHDYRALTEQQILDLEAKSAAQGYTDEGSLDKFRGRQVWIDHGNGIVTRYCHLNSIPANIQAGVQVRQGEMIATTGDSGTPGSVTNPDFEIHLHFEIRVGDTYLAKGLDKAQTRATYEAVFGIVPTAAP